MKNLWKDRTWKPMLLKEIVKPFNSQDYFFEVKFDGIRAVIFTNKKSVKIQSRNGQDLTNLFPELQNIKLLVNKNTIFDGEIIAFDGQKHSFSKIQERLHQKNKTKIDNFADKNPVTFMVFDILYENRNLINLPLYRRKEILNKYEDNDYFIKVQYIETNGIKLFKSVKKFDLEGIVAKNKNGKYYINKRTDEFIKIKNIQRDEFFIGGYEEKKNNLISLSLGEYVNDNFVFVGKVTISEKSMLYKKVKSLKNSKNYFSDFKENIKYVKPTISCYVQYLERTKSNHLRHPVIKN